MLLSATSSYHGVVPIGSQGCYLQYVAAVPAFLSVYGCQFTCLRHTMHVMQQVYYKYCSITLIRLPFTSPSYLTFAVSTRYNLAA